MRPPASNGMRRMPAARGGLLLPVGLSPALADRDLAQEHRLVIAADADRAVGPEEVEDRVFFRKVPDRVSEEVDAGGAFPLQGPHTPLETLRVAVRVGDEAQDHPGNSSSVTMLVVAGRSGAMRARILAPNEALMIRTRRQGRATSASIDSTGIGTPGK